MPLTDAEERLKLAWEIALMDMQIDRGRFDIEKIRHDIDNDRVRNDKLRLEVDKIHQDFEKTQADMLLDQRRLSLQFWGVFATMIAAFAGAFAAGATWWNYIHH
jgi:hypothetical protein